MDACENEYDKPLLYEVNPPPFLALVGIFATMPSWTHSGLVLSKACTVLISEFYCYQLIWSLQQCKCELSTMNDHN